MFMSAITGLFLVAVIATISGVLRGYFKKKSIAFLMGFINTLVALQFIPFSTTPSHIFLTYMLTVNVVMTLFYVLGLEATGHTFTPSSLDDD